MGSTLTGRAPKDADRTAAAFGVDSATGTTVQPLKVNSSTGRLLVDSTGGGGGTQYAELSTTAPATGTVALGRYQTAPPSLTDGQLYGLQLDTAGNLKVAGSLSVGGTTDNSAFTAGTSTGTPSMGFYHSTIDTVTDGRSAVLGMTSKRALLVNLQNATGTEVGTSSVPLQVSLANTAANATAVKVDGSGVTQPVSGTVTANIGTTNGLALDASVTGLQVAQGSTTSGQKGSLLQGAVTTAAPTYTTAQTSPLSLTTSGLLRVDGSGVTQPVSGTITTTPPSNASTNVTQWNGTTVTLNKGASDAGTLRVTLGDGAQAIGSITNTAFTANAGTNLNTSALALESGGNLATIAGAVISQEATTLGVKGVTIFGAVTTSAPTYTTAKSDALSLTTGGALRTDVTTIAGTAPTTAGKIDIKGADGDVFVRQATASNLNATVVGTGTFAVQAAQSGTWTVGASSATGSAVPANAFYKGLLAKTANPTAATDGNLVGALADKLGKQVVVGAIRDLKGVTQTSISNSTSETTIIAQVASTFMDLYGLILANTGASTTAVTIKDSTTGTTRAIIEVPNGETRGFMLPVDSAIPQATVNNNWTATCSVATTNLEVTALWVKNI